jgi:hypothetical protein
MIYIDDYILCGSFNKIDFNKEVKYLLNEGFQPYGVPFSTPDLELSYICQAMVRYNKDNSITVTS